VESIFGLLQLRELAENNKEVNAERDKLKSGLKSRFNRIWNHVTSTLNVNVQPSPELLERIMEACRTSKDTK
jgi:hypothetical protein